jgi:hypothetical protein
MSAQKSAALRPALTRGDDQLHTLQRNTFRYFWEETNPENGLIPNNTSADDIPASIAGVGFALVGHVGRDDKNGCDLVIDIPEW